MAKYAIALIVLFAVFHFTAAHAHRVTKAERARWAAEGLNCRGIGGVSRCRRQDAAIQKGRQRRAACFSLPAFADTIACMSKNMAAAAAGAPRASLFYVQQAELIRSRLVNGQIDEKTARQQFAAMEREATALWSVERSQEQAARQAAVRQSLGNAGRILLQQATSPIEPTTPAPTTTLTQHGVGFLTSQQKSGMNKICYYNVLGSTAALTVSAVSLCPQTHSF